MNPIKALLFTTTLLALVSCTNKQVIVVTSPDQNIKVEIKQDNLKRVLYSVSLNDLEVIQNSLLGIALKSKDQSFIENLSFVNETRNVISESYHAVSGKRKNCSYNANEAIITYKNSFNKNINIAFRVSNNGVAFNYELFNEKQDTVLNEISIFKIDPNSFAWVQKYSPDYEGFYTKRLVDTMNLDCYLCPSLFQTPQKQWILASDAAILDNYTAMQLVHNGNGEMCFQIPQQLHYAYPWYLDTWEEIVMKEDNLIEARVNLKTPWRAFIIGDELGDIVESNLIENLNPQSEIENTDWIKPGVAVFPWWGEDEANDDPAILKDYIDMCAEMNWDYLEFDIGLLGNKGGYSAEFWRNVDYIPEIMEYAKKKGVKVYGWDERKKLDTPEKRADIFGIYQKWGVAGIKIDFLNSDKQEAMAFRADALRDAAKYNLLVSFHGDITPRGMRRTFPNIMTQEGVRGAEYYKFAPDNSIPTSKHNCTLPFTRNVVGPMDYTPTSFSTSRRNSSYVHELALPVVYESGWTCMADKPNEYRSCPAKDYLQRLVAAWDETRFISGYPGKYCVIARKSNEKWMVAGINSGDKQWIFVDFDFLKEGTYNIKVYWDNTDKSKPDKLFYRNETIKCGDRIKFHMEENGGIVILIDKIK